VFLVLVAGCTGGDDPESTGVDGGAGDPSQVDAGASQEGTDASTDSLSCGPASCSGCCMGDTCVEEASASACGAGGATCTVCDASQVCGGGGCDLDPDLRFDMILLDGVVDGTKVSGSSWDIAGGLPDVKVHGWTSYVDEISSSTKDNTTSPNWMGEVVASEARFASGFVVWLSDDDGVQDDFLCQLENCPVNPPNTTLECSATRGTESPSEYDGANAGCTIHYQIVAH
jgi:hypothetical protein